MKIQDFVETLTFNFEESGETIMSPKRVLEEKKAHCLEGALFAAGVLLYHGESAILLDLVTTDKDDSHAVALFKRSGRWGAISKTNHSVLRYRDPVYKSPRELAMSYFHEYFLDSGEKTLRSYGVLDLSKIKKNWTTDNKDLWYINSSLDKAKHHDILGSMKTTFLRSADPIERQTGKLTVWKAKKK